MAGLRGLDEIDSSERVALPRARPSVVPWVLVSVMLVGIGAAGYLGWRERERLTAELAGAKKARDAAKETAAAADAAHEKLVEEMKGREAKIAELTAAVVQKSSEGQTNDKLIADLRSKLDSKDGEVSDDAGHVSVNLVDQILFKSGEAELSPRGQQVLAKVGTVLKELTDKQILIGGHTDDRKIHTERFPSNWELSSARAVNVVHYLVDVAKVDPHKIAAAAYSEFHPRGRAKAKNRRIEILLTPIVEVKKPGKDKKTKR